jgi:hypothetical protein
VVEVRCIVVCSRCNLQWDEDSEAPRCADAGHDHQSFRVHRHLDNVVLPDDTSVTAASFHSADPYLRDRVPDYGLYLDPHWRPPWDHDHLDWPDFGVPESARAVRDALTVLLDRARDGQQVEVGCLGGHGRTGTALACLAVLSGHPADQAVTWTRANYCTGAVETPEQEAFVASFGGEDRDRS